MVTLQPQHQQDLYGRPHSLPLPHPMYPNPPQDPYRGGPQQHLNFNQPAPRQRTAIACRYCRRRKVIRPLAPLTCFEADDSRSAVLASKRPKMDVARIASDSSKTASSPPSRPKRKPSSPRTPPTHISGTPVVCHRAGAVRFTRSKVIQSSTERMANHSGRCRPIRIQTTLKATRCRARVSRTKHRARCMTIEVVRPRIRKIK